MEVKIVKTKEGETFEKSIESLSDVVGKVGWFESARYADKNSTPVASIAAIQEEGSPEHNIPARPFLAPTVHQQGAAWKKSMIDGMRQVFRGKTTINNVLIQITSRAAGQIQKQIAAVMEPPLKTATIKARQRRLLSKVGIPKKLLTKQEAKLMSKQGAQVNLIAKPLVDTGHMRDTLTSKVGPE